MNILSSFRNYAILIGLMLNFLCVALLLFCFATPIGFRGVILTSVASLSLAVYTGTRIGMRIEPMTSIAGEYWDQNVLESLFDKVPPPEEKPLETTSASNLPLQHYQFKGKDAEANRDKLFMMFKEIYSDSYYMDISQQDGTARLTAERNERKNNKSSITLKPLFVFSDKYDLFLEDLSSLSICFLVTSDTATMRHQILSRDEVLKIDPQSKITMGYYDSVRGKLTQLYI